MSKKLRGARFSKKRCLNNQKKSDSQFYVKSVLVVYSLLMLTLSPGFFVSWKWVQWWNIIVSDLLGRRTSFSWCDPLTLKNTVLKDVFHESITVVWD